MKPVPMFSHSKPSTMPVIDETKIFQPKPNQVRTMAYGWFVSSRASAGQDMRRIPSYSQIRAQKVVESLKVVEAAETLQAMKKDTQA